MIVYIRGIYSKFTEDEYRQRYRLDFATDALLNSNRFTFGPGGTTGTVTGTPNVGTGAGVGPERRQDLRLEYKEKSILAGMIGGSSRFGGAKLDYVLARVHNEVREPNELWQFRCNPGTVDFDFSERIYTATPRTECTDAQMNFRQHSKQWETGDEDIWQGKADLTWDLPSFGEKSFVKVGAKYRATDKGFDANNDVWTRGSAANRFTLAQFNLGGSPVISYPDNDDRPFLITPTIDAEAITAFTEQNLDGPRFIRDAATTLANATLNDFTVDEDVSAAYAMANLNFGPVTVTPGLRFERTKTKVVGFRLEEGTVVQPVTADSSYDDVLPSVILRYEPTRELVFRLAYSRSLGRPNYAQLSPGGALEYEAGTAPGTFEGSFASGNADLKPYRSDNFDASGEYYFGRGGLIAVGAFAKRIKNPIFTQTDTQANVQFANRNFALLDITQPMNADLGKIRGIEAAYQQQFTFLPGLLSGLGVELNATIVDSELKLPDGRKSVFPSQSDLLYGGQIFYQRGPLEASIAYHHTGRALLAIGDEAFEDQSNDDLRRLDAKASYALFENLSLFVEGQNLTDEPTRQYQWDRRDWLTQNERYGRTFFVGVSARL
jgi:TonB-dependent receptor